MARGNTCANFPEQTIYTFAAAARILGCDTSTLFRHASVGLLKTVDTPVGRRIHRDEIRRHTGERPSEPDPSKPGPPLNSPW